MGRWSSRYLNALISWAAGVASLVVFLGWGIEDQNGTFPSFCQWPLTYVCRGQQLCLRLANLWSFTGIIYSVTSSHVRLF